MNDKRAQVRELRRQGFTLREIGEMFGFTREYARQLVGEPATRFQPSNVIKIPYVGLREWMFENRVSVAELRRRTGVPHLKVDGSVNIKMKDAKRIMEVTGLSQAECFRRDDQ